MTFSKNREDYLFAGSESGDLLGFQVKNKSLAFNINACAKGIQTIRALTADKVVVGGGDGQIILFGIVDNKPQLLLKTQLFGSIHGLSASTDGL